MTARTSRGTDARIEAVVFDMDGVLLDSEPFWQEAEIEAFGRVGLRLEATDCLRTMGLRVDEVVAFWLDRRPWDTERHPLEAVAEDIVDGVVARVRGRGRMLPGVREGLREVSVRGLPCGLASSSPERVIAATLEALGLERTFEVTVSAQHEARGKPDPGVYLTACRGLDTAPGRSLAVEDSVAGLRAAKAAGMVCAMVPDPSVAGSPEMRRADLVLDSLAGLGPAWSGLERAIRSC